MTQLAFEPAYDSYHTIFRMLRILTASPERLEVDKLRIIDFFLCFPRLVSQFKLKQGDRKFRALGQTPGGYSDLPDGRLAFSRMAPTQAAAMQTLAVNGLIRLDLLPLSWVERTAAKIPTDIQARIEQLNKEQPLLADFVASLATQYSLNGESGLKQRSALMDHRYDVI